MQRTRVVFVVDFDRHSQIQQKLDDVGAVPLRGGEHRLGASARYSGCLSMMTRALLRDRVGRHAATNVSFVIEHGA